MNLEREIRKIQDKADQEIRDLIGPMIQAEFDLCKARDPKLKKILFGNGTFLVVGLVSKPWKYRATIKTTYGTQFEYCLNVPPFMHDLIYLCESISAFGLEDIS